MAVSKNNFDSIEEAIRLLTEGIVDIYFYKKTNGKLRRMHSTLERIHIPAGQTITLENVISNAFSKGAESRPFVVWDLLMGGWRSFYLSSTIEIVPSPVFGDTMQEVEAIVEKETEESEEITEEQQESMEETIMMLMRNKIEKSIEDAPNKIVEFAESKLKQWASHILSNIIAGKSIKR